MICFLDVDVLNLVTQFYVIAVLNPGFSGVARSNIDPVGPRLSTSVLGDLKHPWILKT